MCTVWSFSSTTCGPVRVKKSMALPSEPLVEPPLPQLIGKFLTCAPLTYTSIRWLLASTTAMRESPMVKLMLSLPAP